MTQPVSSTIYADRPPSYEYAQGGRRSPVHGMQRNKSVTIEMSQGTHTCLTVVTSVALAALTAVAAVFLVKYGFYRINTSICRMDLFIGGFSAYMGLAYAITAVGNAVIACCGHFWSNEPEERNETLKTQLFWSVGAPLYFLPEALRFGLYAAIFLQPSGR